MSNQLKEHRVARDREFVRELTAYYDGLKRDRKKAESIAKKMMRQETRYELPDDASLEERLEWMPPEKVTMQQLRIVFETHPDVALAKWDEMRELARERLRVGRDVADTPVTKTWDRVRFLALRDEIIEHHDIAGGIEMQLADQMALAQWYMMKCFRRYDEHFLALWKDHTERDGHGYLMAYPPYVTQHETTEQASAHAERFQRMYARAARILVQLRKARSTINVIGAGQVNMAQNQQVNNENSS